VCQAVEGAGGFERLVINGMSGARSAGDWSVDAEVISRNSGRIQRI
jgi:hypothetical protein